MVLGRLYKANRSNILEFQREAPHLTKKTILLRLMMAVNPAKTYQVDLQKCQKFFKISSALATSNLDCFCKIF